MWHTDAVCAICWSGGQIIPVAGIAWRYWLVSGPKLRAGDQAAAADDADKVVESCDTELTVSCSCPTEADLCDLDHPVRAAEEREIEQPQLEPVGST